MGVVGPSARQDPAGSCVVHTSLRGLLGAVATPVILFALGSMAIVSSGAVRVIPVVLVAAGVVLGLIVALDYPRHTRFGPDGVARVCLARTQRLPWSAIQAIERTPRRTLARVRDLANRGSQPQVTGGLVARGVGRSRWLLTDQAESAEEHDRLAQLMDHLDVPTRLRARRPPEGRPPTDLYRPRRRR